MYRQSSFKSEQDKAKGREILVEIGDLLWPLHRHVVQSHCKPFTHIISTIDVKFKSNRHKGNEHIVQTRIFNEVWYDLDLWLERFVLGQSIFLSKAFHRGGKSQIGLKVELNNNDP